MSTLFTLFLGISRDTWAEAQGRVELCPEISSAVIRPGANSPVRGVWGGVDVNKVVCPLYSLYSPLYSPGVGIEGPNWFQDGVHDNHGWKKNPLSRFHYPNSRINVSLISGFNK